MLFKGLLCAAWHATGHKYSLRGFTAARLLSFDLLAPYKSRAVRVETFPVSVTAASPVPGRSLPSGERSVHSPGCGEYLFDARASAPGRGISMSEGTRGLGMFEEWPE